MRGGVPEEHRDLRRRGGPGRREAGDAGRERGGPCRAVGRSPGRAPGPSALDTCTEPQVR